MAVYFKPPYEPRNPELVIVENKKAPLLKEVLSEKHQPFHKYLNPRPSTATSSVYSYTTGTSSRQSADPYSTVSQQRKKKTFSLFNSEEKQRKIRIVNERNRKSRVINERIYQQNRARSGLKQEKLQVNQQNSHKLTRNEIMQLSSTQKKEFFEKLLDLDIKREYIPDHKQHHLKIRGGTHAWRSDLRDYKDVKKITVVKSPEQRKSIALQRNTMTFGYSPQYVEQQVQTIKSVFKPILKDEQLSAIFPDEQ
ncbi:UNKNOWN [Stylonychia lemnae]|uniref:Uncharacterized protein n=1 Tax=Stylonychia lemnae TaxID=5949 RepID=A0A078A2Z9_STYLE|nr:UNKNOWN [Stylonychia lemnae]|eukprot:CDW76516.1 UNKNOWN [Stylonychia lemnae]